MTSEVMCPSLDMLSQGAGICVPLVTAWHFTAVRLVYLVRPHMFEAVARVRVGFVASLKWTDIWPLSCR